MGKWCFMNRQAEMVPGISAKRAELVALTDQQLHDRWVTAGSPDLTDYGLSWYWGGSGGGWACIDDSHSRKTFQLFVSERPGNSDANTIYWSRLAATACFELSMSKYSWTPEEIPKIAERAVDLYPGRFIPAEDYFTLTCSNVEGFPNHRTFKAMQSINLLEVAKEVLAEMDPGTLKVNFVTYFITLLINTEVIMEIVPVEKLRFTNGLTDSVTDEAFLKAWLG